MKTLMVIALFVLVEGTDKERSDTRYGFYRSMERESSDEEEKDAPAQTRRVFGGEAADIDQYPAAAALLDRYWTTRCSGAVISEYWALTAAHCVTSRVAYVMYNTRTPTAAEGDHSPVLYLYRHPNYKVVQEDEGRGMDVTLLHHDLGLLRTRDPMVLKNPMDPLVNMRRYNPATLDKEEVMVMGFGRTEIVTRASGEELFAVRLRLSFCDRGTWFHCICGVASTETGARGVCSGDSGGPVVYRGVQVAVTSMGPLECATARSQPSEGATSVFTSLYNYVDLINATIKDTEEALRKRAYASSSTNIIRLHVAMITTVFLTFIIL